MHWRLVIEAGIMGSCSARPLPVASYNPKFETENRRNPFNRTVLVIIALLAPIRAAFPAS